MKWILLITLISVSALVANAGHSVNNGGGVICINGVCKTLIEAGLEVKPEYEGVWIPDGETIKLVHEAIGPLALAYLAQQDLAVRILGRLDQFRKAEVIDPAKLEAIKRQYIDVAAQAGFKIDPTTFELVAFSSDDTVKPALTYVLPKFFELTKRQQAAILIHEGLYRGQPTGDLRYVLQFENAAKVGVQVADKVNLQIAAYHLRIIGKSQLLGHLLMTAASRDEGQGLGKDYLFGSKYGDVVYSKDLASATFTFDQSKVLKVSENEPRLSYILSKTNELKFKYVIQYPSNGGGGDSILELDPKGALHLTYSMQTNANIEYELENPEQLDLILPK